MTNWFTSDLHLDHKNVITYASRPFKSVVGQPDVELMNETLIARWNEVVKPEDCIYILGDISCGSAPDRVYEHIRRLAGRKYLIFGNHDKAIRKSKRVLELFEWARDFAEIKIGWDPTNKNRSQSITLCHYAMRVWNKSHYGAWQLYGHSHGNLADDPHALQLDVGVDAWDYRPVSFEQIQARMKQKVWKPIDHHGAEHL